MFFVDYNAICWLTLLAFPLGLEELLCWDFASGWVVTAATDDDPAVCSSTTVDGLSVYIIEYPLQTCNRYPVELLQAAGKLSLRWCGRGWVSCSRKTQSQRVFMFSALQSRDWVQMWSNCLWINWWRCQLANQAFWGLLCMYMYLPRVLQTTRGERSVSNWCAPSNHCSHAARKTHSWMLHQQVFISDLLIFVIRPI